MIGTQRTRLGALAALAVMLAATTTSAVNIKHICKLRGVRENRLIGYGLVTGLNGTGDGEKFKPAIDALTAVMQKLNRSDVAQGVTDARSVAVVLVSATLPAFNKPGEKIDVQLSSVGPAGSLKGGRLLLTPLQGPSLDDVVYAVASGPVAVTGDNPKTATVRGGAIIERPVPPQYIFDGKIFLELNFRDADFTTASFIAGAINEKSEEYGTKEQIARALSADTIEVSIPPLYKTRSEKIDFISKIERVRINQLGRGAVVVVNPKTKTIVASGDVELSPGIVAHKNLTVSIGPEVENINRDPLTVIGSRFFSVPTPNPTEGTNLDTLLQGLRQFKATPDELIDILIELKNANLLHAHLVIVEG